MASTGTPLAEGATLKSPSTSGDDSGADVAALIEKNDLRRDNIAPIQQRFALVPSILLIKISFSFDGATLLLMD